MRPAYLSFQSILLVSTKFNRAETSLFIAVIYGKGNSNFRIVTFFDLGYPAHPRLPLKMPGS